MKKTKLVIGRAERAERKVAKDGRFYTKKRRPRGTKTEPLYLYLIAKAAAHAKAQGSKKGSISMYVEKLILRDKAKKVKSAETTA